MRLGGRAGDARSGRGAGRALGATTAAAQNLNVGRRAAAIFLGQFFPLVSELAGPAPGHLP